MPEAHAGQAAARGLLGLAVTVLLTAAVHAAGPAPSPPGPFGPEGPRLREQLWMLPSGDPAQALRATVFRPEDAPGAAPLRRPLVVINHGTSEATRLSVSMPVFYWLSRWFVERGYVVVLPQRRGHGATGGALAEDVGTCARPDHRASGLVAADDIAAVVDFMSRQPGIAADETIVVGISTGGWAALALAARNPKGVIGIVNFAGGRGGHAKGVANAVCGRDQLIAAAASYARTARVPTAWFYSRNDSYFDPRLAADMARAWVKGGGRADLHLVAAYADDGHDIASDQAGWDLWGADLERFLASVTTRAVATSVATTAPQATLEGGGEGEQPR